MMPIVLWTDALVFLLLACNSRRRLYIRAA
jgi:hypothetical protein